MIENFQPEWILRLLLALLGGLTIGFERHNRAKAAGLRTHAIVAMAACLLMLVSKYGFEGTDKYDAARVAAQVVSGVGFLGAGVIFVRNDTVQGLTTAAGIFMTCALGLCFGAGMYISGLITLVFMVLIKLMLRRINHVSRISMCVSIHTDRQADPDIVKEVVHDKGFHIYSMIINAVEDGYIIQAEVYTIHKENPFELLTALRLAEHVSSVEVVYDN